MGKRSRARGRAEKLTAPESEYTSPQGDVLVLRGALTAKTRRQYHETLHGNVLSQEDAWQRATELLFERLAVRWVVADVPTGYCLDVQPGEAILVRSTTLAEPLLLELQRAILQRDAWPLLRVELPGQMRAFYEDARDRHLDDYPDLAHTEARKIDALLGIQAPGDTRELAGVDPDRIARYARARRPIREATMKKRWCSTLWPTDALAEQAGMPAADFPAFLRGALFLDQPNPLRRWGGLPAFQERLIARLSDARELRLEAEGTDLTLGVAGRPWVNSDGRRNMPSGEVFTGP